MLTEKELDVLRRRAAGESQQAIAKSLRISQAAVSKFETNAHRKILSAEELLQRIRSLNVVIGEGLAGRRVDYKRGGRK